MQLPATVRATALASVAEGDDTHTLRSYMGQPRRLRAAQSRAPCRHRGKAANPGLSNEQVPTLVLRDRFGQTAHYVLARDDARHIVPVLAQCVAADAILSTDASTALAAAARTEGIAH